MTGRMSDEPSEEAVLEAAIRKLERGDLMVERITGRTFCPICGGLGWYKDEQGEAHDCPPTA